MEDKKVLRKPLVIEFAGTPNSGKNTQIEILADYLRDYRKMRVSIVDEVYHLCTVYGDHKKRLLWMYGTLIKNFMEVTDEKDFDVVLINRGLFDTLAFFELYYKQGYINKADLAAFSNTLSSNSLCKMEDVVIILTTTPEISLQREIIYPRSTVADLAKKYDQWDPNPNSTLTNKDGLHSINECYDIVLQKHQGRFTNTFSVLDNGNKTIDDVANEIFSYLHPLFAQDKTTFTADQILLRRKNRMKVKQLSFGDLMPKE